MNLAKYLTALMGIAVATLLVGTGAPAAAQGDDPEMQCVSALADKLAVSMDQISSDGSRHVGEGTEVHLSAGDGHWNCYVNDSGKVTSFEEIVTKRAARPAAVSPAQLRANCKKAAEKFLHLRPGDATIGEVRDVADQVEIDASYYAQTVTCTVDKASGRVLNVG